MASALQRLRGWEDVDAEMLEMHLEDHSEKAEGRLSVLSLLSQRSLRWQLISIIIMNMGQQLSGVNAVRCACPVVPVPHIFVSSVTEVTFLQQTKKFQCLQPLSSRWLIL